MNKDIHYYLSLPYTRELIPDPEGGWFVRIKELPGCMSQGDTPEEALQMIEDAMRGWLEAELRKGSPIPEPRVEEEYSGKFVIRVPKSLHRKLAELAEREGVSLNQWINTALAEAVGRAYARESSSSSLPVETEPKGLTSTIRKILEQVNPDCSASEMDEKVFASWLDRNLSDIRLENKEKRILVALEKAKALQALLREYRFDSPIIGIIHSLICELSDLIEQNVLMNQKVEQAEIMRKQISRIIGSVNQNLQIRTLVEEEEIFSTYRPEEYFSKFMKDIRIR